MTEVEKIYEKNKNEADLAKYGRIRSERERKQTEEKEARTRQEFEKIVAEEEKEARKERKIRAYLETVPKKYKGASFDGFRIEGQYKENHQEVVDYMRTLAPLVLAGDNGAGKTYLGYAGCLKTVQRGGTACLIVALDFFDEIKLSFKGKGPKSIIEKYGYYDYLVMDELDKTQGSRTEFIYLSRLVNFRDAEMLTTIILTNAIKTDVVKIVGPAVVDRVAGEGKLLELKVEESFRLKRRRENEKLQKEKA
jgi:DNA replication protein DnaC